MKEIALPAAALLAFALAVVQPAHADEPVTICQTLYPGETAEDGTHLGWSTDDEPATYCYERFPAFDGCTKMNGSIWYDPRSEAPGEVTKVLPDLQAEADSGADTLCVVIVPPYYKQSWMEIPGWEEHGAKFPDASKYAYARDVMAENAGSIVRFLEDGGASFRGDYRDFRYEFIHAAIPAGLLPVLADRDDVVKVGMWWKDLRIPLYIREGHESKIDPLIQKEIEHGRKNCADNTGYSFENCPPLERNSDGTPTVRVMIDFEEGAEWPDEPLADFLARNNQTVTWDSPWGVSAYVAADLLPELEARDEVRMIASGNAGGQILGFVIDDSYNHPSSGLPSPSAGSEHSMRTKSPLQQYRDGVAVSDIECRGDLVLVMLPDGRPACLTEATAVVLAERMQVQ